MSEPEDELAESEVPFPLRRYRPPDLTHAEFEEFVGEVVRDMLEPVVAQIDVLERHHRYDGIFEIDITARYRVGEFDHLMLVEAKLQGRAVERDQVMILHSKMASIGAQKGVIFTTSGFQRGAMKYAQVHGLGLVLVTADRAEVQRRALGTVHRGPAPRCRAVGVSLFGEDERVSARHLVDRRSRQHAFEQWTGEASL